MAKLFTDRPQLIEQISEIIVERQFLNKEFIDKHKNKKNAKQSLVSQLFQ